MDQKIKKEIYFDEAEKELADQIEKNDLPVLGKKQKRKCSICCRYQLKQTGEEQNDQFAPFGKEFAEAQGKAAQEDLYETFIASILHKYVSNQFHL